MGQTALALSTAAAIAWLVILGVQPVHVPLRDFSKGHIPAFTQALSGVKGQTLIVPSDRLSRVDIWMRTRIQPDEHIQVTFDLIDIVDQKDVLASGIVVFNRSGDLWQVRVVFDPELVSKGNRIYLRMSSVLSSPEASLHYAFVRGDLYVPGQLRDADRVDFPDQDLRFRLYLEPMLPKPFAWLETVLGPTATAAVKAKGPPTWIVTSITVVIGALIAASTVLGTVFASRFFQARLQLLGTAALLFIELAVVMTILAGAEAPIAKLWVQLT